MVRTHCRPLSQTLDILSSPSTFKFPAYKPSLLAKRMGQFVPNQQQSEPTSFAMKPFSSFTSIPKTVMENLAEKGVSKAMLEKLAWQQGGLVQLENGSMEMGLILGFIGVMLSIGMILTIFAIFRSRRSSRASRFDEEKGGIDERFVLLDDEAMEMEDLEGHFSFYLEQGNE